MEDFEQTEEISRYPFKIMLEPLEIPLDLRGYLGFVLTRLSYNSLEIEVNLLNTNCKQIVPVHKNVKFNYYSVNAA